MLSAMRHVAKLMVGLVLLAVQAPPYLLLFWLHERIRPRRKLGR